MKKLFTAISDRFTASTTMESLGRKLYRGFRGQILSAPRPHVVVELEMQETLDTFGADIENWAATFRFMSKDRTPDDADAWLEATVDTFDTALLTSDFFTCCLCEMQGKEGPFLADGSEYYDAAMTFDIVIQRLAKLPATRMA